MLNSTSHRMSRRSAQAGLSLIELMVGIAIGLIVVAAATTLMATQMVENRRLLTETQLQQDLRATADIMARELRRAGTLADVPSYVPGSPETVFVETPTAFIPAASNRYAPLLSTPTTDSIEFAYSASDTSYLPGDFGFKLLNGEILSRMTGTIVNYQPLTDRRVMVITGFEINMASPATASSTAILVPCPKRCADGTANCWPQYSVRDVVFTIEAQAANDANVRRAVTTRVRVRADHVRFRVPPPSGTNTLVCPA